MSNSGKHLSEESNSAPSCTDTSCCPPNNPVVRAAPKIGRNDPCICGNGQKYKKCCGKNA
ncbi:SEC-C metal-binding domain-containing protein [Zhongshania aliphaticivorans]|uniref:SEC-C metal-binding domain-containing protein n=1 Tax=Zhongshania aliphaticivorans TaxID=1470434 RepID=UPI001330CA0B|nr:SEC-C metal-binding domain-containing protein [Zhongshania aliphaticivorans]